MADKNLQDNHNQLLTNTDREPDDIIDSIEDLITTDQARNFLEGIITPELGREILGLKEKSPERISQELNEVVEIYAAHDANIAADASYTAASGIVEAMELFPSEDVKAAYDGMLAGAVDRAIIEKCNYDYTAEYPKDGADNPAISVAHHVQMETGEELSSGLSALLDKAPQSCREL